MNTQGFVDLLPDLPLDPALLSETFRGWQFDRVVAEIEHRHDTRLGEDFEARYRAHVAAMFETGLRPFPGVAEALAQIDCPICVASNAPLAKISAALRICGLERFFGDKLFSAHQVRAWKPDPALFLAAARGMGFAPADCLVVEDSEAGVQGAVAAGMRVLRFVPGAPTGTGVFGAWRDLPAILSAAPYHVPLRESPPG